MTAEPRQLHPRTVAIDHNDIRWRVANTWMKGDAKMGMLVGYIDARTCMEALDTLDPNWSAVHGDPIIVGNELIGVPCALTVNGVTRSDVGMPSSQDPIKGAYSDALKRAAVHFDIGRELYELPKIAVECEVGRDGKVKAPKATPVYRNGRWEIDRKLGWVKYDRDPDEQPERSERAPGGAGRRPGSRPATTSAPVQRSPEEQALIDRITAEPGMTRARMDLMADSVGVPKGQHASADQLREMISRFIDQPSAGVPASDGIGEAEDARATASPDNPPSDGQASVSEPDGPVSVTVPPGGQDDSPRPSDPAAPAPFSDPQTLATYGSTVLGFDEVVALKDWSAADWDQVIASLNVPDYGVWFEAQERPIRQALRVAKQSPRQRADRAKEVAKRPDAEQLKAAIGGES